MAKKDNSLEKFTPALVVISVILAFAVGILWQKVSVLESGGVNTRTTTGTNQGTDTAPPPAQQGPSQGKMTSEEAAKIPEVTARDHVRGASNPQVYLIEYSDYECPFCARFHPTAQQVIDEYGDSVAWVYRHYPLDQLHPKARPSAEAAECVAELGGEDAFWQFTDNLFTDQSNLNDLEAAAVEVGVSATAFNNCFDSGKYAEYVEEQFQGGMAAGVRGTPGNFVLTADGEAWFLPGAFPFEQFKTAIDEALSS